MAGSVRFDFNRRALDDLVNSGEMEADLAKRAARVRDKARSNAASVSSALAGAIEVEPGSDSEGSFADIGYLRSAPGFVLWWHEVGTEKFPASPHLRPALDAGK